jgi:hypothetical protein
MLNKSPLSSKVFQIRGHTFKLLAVSDYAGIDSAEMIATDSFRCVRSGYVFPAYTDYNPCARNNQEPGLKT